MTRIEVRGACPHDCPDTCAWIATVDDGVVTGVHGDPDHPVTAGHLCVKVQKYEERVYHPDRLLAPLVRVGPRGERSSFRETTWDDALGRVRDGLAAAIDRGGASSVLPWHYMGTQGVLQGGPSMDARFANALGAAHMLGTICFAAGGWASGLVYPGRAPADIEDAVHARTVVAWGANMVSTHLHLWKLFLDARKQGATIVCVDPVRTRTAKAADVHLALRPGSDAALALGVMHVLFTEGLADEEFLASDCDGADELRARAMEWPVDRAARATGLRDQQIVEFARLVGAGPAFVKIGPGAQRDADAGEGVRAAIMLPAVTGAWRHRGGGALVASAGIFPFPEGDLARPDLRGDRPTRMVNMVQLGRALAGTLDGEPPINALLVYSANPMVVAPDTNAVRAGMQRDDLFTVVLEQFPTETAMLADVVLPATTQLEHLDVLWSWGHQYLTLNRPAIATRGQSRPNTEIFRMLAAAMADIEPALGDDALHDDDETLLATYLAAYPEATRDELLEQGWVKWSPPPSEHPPKIALRSDAAVGLGLGAVPIARDAPDDDGRVVVLTPKSHHFLNSQFVNHERLMKMAGAPHAAIARADADARGIVEGDRVRLHNEHGVVDVTATISDDVPSGTVVLLSNWWQSQLPGGAAANALTGQDLADLGGAPIFTPRAELSRV